MSRFGVQKYEARAAYNSDMHTVCFTNAHALIHKYLLVQMCDKNSQVHTKCFTNDSVNQIHYLNRLVRF